MARTGRRGEFGAIEPDELDIRRREIVSWCLAEGQDTDHRRNSISGCHPKRPELVGGRALILRDDVGRDDRWNVRVFEEVEVQVAHRRGLDRVLIEGQEVIPALLGELALLVRRCDVLARSDADPDAISASDGRRGRRLNEDDGDVAPLERALLDHERWKRQDAAIVLEPGERSEQRIVDLRPCAGAVIA